MELSRDFWDAFKGLVLIDTRGGLHFSRTGYGRYAPLFAKYGFAVDAVKTIERFRAVLAHVNAGELEANTLELDRIRSDPATDEAERAWITRVLAEELPAPAVALRPDNPTTTD